MRSRFGIVNLTFCLCLMVLIALYFSSPALYAQEYPVKPVHIVIPSAAGGSMDLATRTFGHLAPDALGQPLIVQIREGGGGAIGSELVAQAKPDGYTLIMAHTNHNCILPAVDGRSRGPEDFEAVCRINLQNPVYWVLASSPFKTIKDVIDYAKANTGKLALGNSGTWSLPDLEMRWLEMKAGISIRNVPYNGGGACLLGLLGGHVQVAMLPTTQCLPHYRSGKLRPLAVQGSKRDLSLPNVPSMKEEGYDTGMAGLWMGVAAPKGTPRPIVEKLAVGFKKMTENGQAIENFAKLGNTFGYMGPDEFAKYWREDFGIYKEMAKLFKK